MKRLFICFFSMTVFCLLACQKENEHGEKNHYLAADTQIFQDNSLLKFNSFNDVIDYMFDDNSSPNDNFVSLGDYMDKAYFELNPEKTFSSIEELKEFAEKNSNYYQLILLSDGDYLFETRYYNHPYRNVANKEGLFQVGDTIYKIIEGGLAFTSVNEAIYLKDLTGNKNYSNSNTIQYFMFDDTPFATTLNYDTISDRDLPYPDPCSQNCNSEYDDYSTYGSNRIKLTITKIAVPPTEPGVYSTSIVGMKYTAKPYHKTIAWFGCYRTISGSFDATIHYWVNSYVYDNYYGWNVYHPTPTSFTKYGSSHTINKDFRACLHLSQSQSPRVHFGHVNSWASTPDPGCYISFTCNN